MKKVMITILAFTSVLLGAQANDVLTLASGNKSFSQRGDTITTEKVKSNSGDLSWDIGETVVMSFDFSVSDPNWIKVNKGFAVGIGVDGDAACFGIRFRTSKEIRWNCDVDADSKKTRLRPGVKTDDEPPFLLDLLGTSADLRNDGDAAHFVFTATRNTATQYTLNAKWYSSDRSVSEEIKVVCEPATAVESYREFYLEINELKNDRPAGFYELTNLEMTVMSGGGMQKESFPETKMHKESPPEKEVKEPETIGLLL